MFYLIISNHICVHTYVIVTNTPRNTLKEKRPIGINYKGTLS